ncbi:MAG: outer membrane lipoprotein-sorting protein [bacterium]|nr:outer membrane lipoprotein-sorting protein [bacterium]
MKFRMTLLTTLLLMAIGAGIAQAQDAAQIMTAAHKAYYYAGDGGQAKVQMVLTDKKGRTRERNFWMLRRDIEDLGDQNYYTYFITPADVRKTGFLVHKHADGNDDRWLYVPALDLVKRIAADDRSGSFIGSDFSFEDVSGRLPSLDKHEMAGEDTVLDRATWKIRSEPKDTGTAEWEYKFTWICQETDLPLKEEFYKKGKLAKVFEVGAIELVEGFPTATVRKMTDVKRGKFTSLNFEEITYSIKLKAGDFTERLLKNPPREYTR